MNTTQQINPLSIAGWEIDYINDRGEEDTAYIHKRDQDAARYDFEESTCHMGVIEVRPLTLSDIL